MHSVSGAVYQHTLYTLASELIVADKNDVLSKYNETKRNLLDTEMLLEETESQAKSTQYGSQAARIAVIAFSHILTHAVCMAVSSAPLLLASCVILSPAATIAIVVICIIIAIVLQVITHYYLLKKSNLDKLCTFMGIDELDKKANDLQDKLAEIKDKKTSLERKLDFQKLNAKSQWEAKKSNWNGVIALFTKYAENSVFTRDLPPEVIANIAEYVIYTPKGSPNLAT